MGGRNGAPLARMGRQRHARHMYPVVRLVAEVRVAADQPGDERGPQEVAGCCEADAEKRDAAVGREIAERTDASEFCPSSLRRRNPG